MIMKQFQIETNRTVKCEAFGTRFNNELPIITDEQNAFRDIGNALAKLIDNDEVTTIVISKQFKKHSQVNLSA